MYKYMYKLACAESQARARTRAVWCSMPLHRQRHAQTARQRGGTKDGGNVFMAPFAWYVHEFWLL